MTKTNAQTVRKLVSSFYCCVKLCECRCAFNILKFSLNQTIKYLTSLVCYLLRLRQLKQNYCVILKSTNLFLLRMIFGSEYSWYRGYCYSLVQHLHQQVKVPWLPEVPESPNFHIPHETKAVKLSCSVQKFRRFRCLCHFLHETSSE